MNVLDHDAAIVRVREADFGYAGRAVVRAGSIDLHRGHCLGLFGHNGSGKTTLVRGLLGLLPPINGRVERDGMPRLGYLSQYRGIDLAWPMTGSDAASLAVSGRRRFGLLPQRARAGVFAAMERMHVADLAHRPFAALSGGQQQRLLLAGALADEPDLLVLDEPTDGLDVVSRERLLGTLRELKRSHLSVVIISHDLDDLLAVCDTIAWLHPADTSAAPSTVECVLPDELAQRLVRGGAR